MVAYQLLIRCIHAAKVAREEGFDNTANALDDLVDSLSALIDASAQPEGQHSSQQMPGQRPRRLSTRLG